MNGVMNEYDSRKLRVIIAGGGTGGHIFPAVAIANALKRSEPGIEILFVGAKGKMEMEKVPQAGFTIIGLDIAGFNRSSLIKNIGLPFKLVKSFFQVRKIFSDFNPDAAIGVGGYSSFPVLRYAQQKRIPTFILESNSFAGRSNIMLGKKATKIFVAADKMEKFFPGEKITVTGNPVRTAIVESRISRNEGVLFFGLNPVKKTLLSVGGSLGAKSINQAIDAGLEELGRHDLQIIWQTGKPYAERGKEASAQRTNVWVNEFISQMEYAFAAADVVISRAGAIAIAELCMVKKPAILVPFPYAAEDHQMVNANYLENKHAGIVIKDSEAMAKLVPAIVELARNEEKQNQLKENIGKLAVKNADRVIAEEILKSLRKLEN